MRPLLLCLSLLALAHLPGPAAQTSPAGARRPAVATNFAATFGGSVGPHRVTAKLAREGGKLSGTYYYESGRPRRLAALTLEGTIDAAGRVSLRETDAEGKQTGQFKGELSGGEEQGAGRRFTGTWSKTAGAPALPFSLAEQLPTLDGEPLRLTMRKVSRAPRRQKFTITASYPQFLPAGEARVARLNAEVENFVQRTLKGFNRDMVGYDDGGMGGGQKSFFDLTGELAGGGDGIVSLYFNQTAYFAGAAHPNSSGHVINFDLRTGRALRLADLFRPRAPYLREIARHAIAALIEGGAIDNDWVRRGAAPQAENYENWNLTPGGLLITFDPYQVASYAEGPQEVLIPYASLPQILIPDGPAARFTRSEAPTR